MKRRFVVILLLVPVACAAFAQTQATRNPADTVLEQQALRAKQREARMLERWTGSDAPYLAVAHQIDRSLAAGKKPAKLAAAFKIAALRKPRDPLAQFRWAYAAFKASDTVSFSQPRPALRGVPEALWKAPSPRSYRYARLLFLCQSASTLDETMLPLGKRLLKRNPKDSDALYFVSPLLVLTKPPQVKQAAKYARTLLQSSPNSLKYNLLMGYVYSAASPVTPDNTTKALAAYRRCLQLAPPNTALHQRIQFVIRMLQSEQERQRKQ